MIDDTYTVCYNILKGRDLFFVIDVYQVERLRIA